MANTVLQLIAIALAVLSGFALSMGALTPEIVRRTGQRFAGWLQGRAWSDIMESARISVVGPPKKDNWLENVGYQCVVHFVAQMMTHFIAIFIVWVMILVASCYGIIFYRQLRIPGAAPIVGSRIILALSIFGLLVAISSFLAFLSEQLMHRENVRSKKIAALIHPLGRLSIVLSPFVTPTRWFVSIFTIYLPQSWFRCLKVVDSKGMNWLLNLVGFAMLFIGAVLQAISLFVPTK